MPFNDEAIYQGLKELALATDIKIISPKAPEKFWKPKPGENTIRFLNPPAQEKPYITWIKNHHYNPALDLFNCDCRALVFFRLGLLIMNYKDRNGYEVRYEIFRDTMMREACTEL